MRRRKILENRVRVLFQQLEVIHRYPEDFKNELGLKGKADLVNAILDEINWSNREIAKIDSKKDKK